MRNEVEIGVSATLIVFTALAALGTVAYMAPLIAQNGKQNSCQSGTSQELTIPKDSVGISRNCSGFQLFNPELVEKALVFLKNANKTEHTGDIVTFQGHVLMLNMSGGQTVIVVARSWVSNGKVVTINDLFANGTLSVGAEVTVSTLEVAVNNVFIAFGYMMRTESATIRAFLPFNVR